MSAAWYEYLEETGGEVIPLSYFKHVCRSLEKSNFNEHISNRNFNEIKFAYNYEKDIWWPVVLIEELSEGWIKFQFYGILSRDNCLWCDLKSQKNNIKSIRWCLDNGKVFKTPNCNLDIDIDVILKENQLKSVDELDNTDQKSCYVYETIKVGAYLECWLENSVGFVWPVKVMSNIGGRLKLTWFGCDSTSKAGSSNSNNAFFMFYLDHRLHGLGWARLNGWKYSPPLNIGIGVSISNVDTFVRGSPSAFPIEIGCDREMKEHFFEEGWQVEAVNPVDPSRIHSATIRYVLNKKFFLVELDMDNIGNHSDDNNNNGESIMFAGFGSMSEILPANMSGVSGYSIAGLKENSWEVRLMSGNSQKYAPHLGYFQNGGGVDCHQGSVFLPGCKLEAINPWNRQQIHAATITRAMEGSRLVWIHLDSDPDQPDFLVDPYTSTDIFPVGWCEMMHHPIVMPHSYTGNFSFPAPFDQDDITVYFRPSCYLGPYLSRSVATEILPQFIGPGHCLPVLRELFHLLLKVSHKPYKLMQLLQIDDGDDRHELMATIAVPSPKSDWVTRNNNKRSDWLVEVAVRKRAILEFCRQTALSLGSCPSFISTSRVVNCHLGCGTRMATKIGEKMSVQRRKRLFMRPLASLGISYRELKLRVVGSPSNSSSNSELDSSDREDQDKTTGTTDLAKNALETRMCTRGMRLVMSESRRRASKRRSMGPGLKFLKNPKFESIKIEDEVDREDDEGLATVFPADFDRRETRGRDTLSNSVIDVRDFVIDPTFLAGDIEQVTLSTNPLTWTVDQLVDYLSGTDCRQLTTWLANEKVDGRAFLLLTLPVLSTLCGLQLEVAIRLCRHVVSLKRVFVEKFADLQKLLPDYT